jgi:hypothetical protein
LCGWRGKRTRLCPPYEFGCVAPFTNANTVNLMGKMLQVPEGPLSSSIPKPMPPKIMPMSRAIWRSVITDLLSATKRQERVEVPSLVDTKAYWRHGRRPGFCAAADRSVIGPGATTSGAPDCAHLPFGTAKNGLSVTDCLVGLPDEDAGRVNLRGSPWPSTFPTPLALRPDPCAYITGLGPRRSPQARAPR